jgi:GNAT superfamily N-acetyltransferase
MSKRKPFEQPIQFDTDEEDEYGIAIPAGGYGPFDSRDHIVSLHTPQHEVKGRIDVDPESGTINSIEVRKPFRRQGVGTRLVQEARALSEQFDVVAPTIQGSTVTDRGRKFFRQMESRGVLPTNIADELPRAGNDGRGSYRD